MFGAEEVDVSATASSWFALNAKERGERELNRRTTQLAMERAALFEKAGASIGLSAGEQQRLTAVERQLDECFLARRRERALNDARRFDRDAPIIRRAKGPPQ